MIKFQAFNFVELCFLGNQTENQRQKREKEKEKTSKKVKSRSPKRFFQRRTKISRGKKRASFSHGNEIHQNLEKMFSTQLKLLKQTNKFTD